MSHKVSDKIEFFKEECCEKYLKKFGRNKKCA